MARLPNFLVIIRSEKLSGKGQGRGAKKRTFRFGKKNVSFPKVETFRFADYTCAFQDGHIDYDELDAFFSVNKKMADKYGIECWTNAESFDRDMPIKFLPIKFDKLRMKLEAAARQKYDKAITFEFSHFMSPQSAYLQAGHLYDRYKEYFEIG